MTQINAQIVADSKNPQGDRITTMMVTFPRIILAELNTHRMFSRNSASSRAIPFEKMVQSIQENPFIPIAWQKDHKGMQGTEYFTDEVEIEQRLKYAGWLEARDYAVMQAKFLSSRGLTKQLCNRLLEPFMWHTVLITATEFENFFSLRCPSYQFGNRNIVCKSKKDYLTAYKELYGRHPDEGGIFFDEPKNDIEWLKINKGQAEIHMMALAEAMWDAMNESTPKQLKAGEWHIPFGNKIHPKIMWEYLTKQNGGIDAFSLDNYSEEYSKGTIKVATARCARVSYTVVGEEGKEPNYENDIKLHDRLVTSGHWSPFEHCAKSMDDDEYFKFIKGEVKEFVMGHPLISNDDYGWCNNFKGFIQYRYLLENESKT